MSEIILERFSIHGLNGEYNVDLKVVDNKKIIVAENGSGKTTILNILYLFLTGNEKIFNYDFYYIEIVVNGESFKYYKELLKIVLNHDIIIDFENIDFSNIKKFSNNILKIEGVDNRVAAVLFLIFFCKEHQDDNIGRMGFKRDYYKSAITAKKLIDDIFSVYRLESVDFNYKDLQKNIDDLFYVKMEDFNLIWLIDEIKNERALFDRFKDLKIIYLPTYRMVEHSISSFNNDNEEDFEYNYYDDDDVEKYLEKKEMKFGAKDIEKVWLSLSNKIKASTSEGFFKTSASLIKNIINDRKIRKVEVVNLIKNKKSIDKVISRLDKDVFNDKDRKKIKDLINNDFKECINDSSLFYVLDNMVTIYDGQKNIDEAIDNYCKVVNKFLIKKKVVFNDQNSEIYVLKDNNKRISVEKLSSGEKQLLLIFTKLYLTNINGDEKDDEKYWIIYDEPEISLSIEWQILLLPEILNSNRCQFLISATHSPFIFKNDLRKYASDLSLEIEEID
ncbi:AAA family ATPase [Acinetobacter sp. 1207_04]|uniref:AAA family ATPase n=1 Tax=Acinetobacter sp. 1207_04 TaxID=2604449 RepID=UPI00405907DD